MEKSRSLGVTIISKIEIVIGTIGIFCFIPLGIGELLNELYGSHGTSERYVGFGVDVILGVICSIILITGKLTYKLRPAGRVLHLFFSVLFIILYFLLFYVLRCKLEYILNFWVLPISPLFFIFFFTRPKVKEQFK